MNKEPLKRTWRKPGIFGIKAIASKLDPCFWIDSLPSPFSVFFPVSISNLYTATIYITALMVSPPTGWSDSEQNIGLLTPGTASRFEKSNATRTTPTVPLNETITVRWNYRTGSYAGPVIGYDDITMTIYWERIADGIVDTEQSFETPCDPDPPYACEGWIWNPIWTYLAYPTRFRDSSIYVHGAFSMAFSTGGWGPPLAGYFQKSQTIGPGSRAAIFGFCRYNYSYGEVLFQCVTPVETLNIVHWGSANWRRFGCRLNPGASNNVRLYIWWYWGVQQFNIDYIRWVRWV